MKEISALDGFVFIAIAVSLMPFEVPVVEIIKLILSVLRNVPIIIFRIALHRFGLTSHKVSHYDHVSNPVQQLIIQLAGFAFDKVHYKIGRLFLGRRTSLLFAKWRLGHNLKGHYQTLTIPGTRRHKETLIYQIGRNSIDHESPKNVILYVHGGGFVVASVMFYLEFLLLLQSRLDDTVILSPEYDLVPESTHPTQINQVVATYEYIKKTYPRARVILGGDSAGGGLCQALLLHLSKMDAIPSAGIWKAFYISPWLDLDARYHRPEGHGDFISVDAIKRYGRWYTPGRWDDAQSKKDIEREDVPASPLSADDESLIRSIPSGGLYITCGGAECLLSDAKSFTSRIKHKSPTSPVSLHIEPNEVHAHVLTNLYLRRGLNRFSGLQLISEFIQGSDGKDHPVAAA